MSRKMIAVASLSVAALALAINAQADDKVTLKVKWAPGSYTQTSTVQSSSVVGDKVMGKSTQEMTSSYTVARPDDEGNTKVAFQIRRFKITTSAGGQTMTIDTSKPDEAEGPMAKAVEVLARLTKVEVTIVVAADGKIKEVTGLDKMWDEVAKTDPQLAAMAENMRKSMGDEMVRKMIVSQLGGMPDKPVGVGDEWTSDIPYPIPMLGDSKLKLAYKLKALEDGGKVAVIEIKGKLEPKTGAPGDGDQAPPAPTLTMAMDGTVRINIDNSLLNSAETTTTGRMEQGGQTTTFTSKATTKTVKADEKTAPGEGAGDKKTGGDPKSSEK